MNAADKIRSLTQIHNFDGTKVTPPVDPACKL
jgi:branched-chain amino acid transport system substrate-binding protein